ncbi:hypothetical protein RclHR1_12630008 [Rhizophagus clarus]|nr:hypothetical protein RclHR1_12630008 [Rhizophagus clarus]
MDNTNFASTTFDNLDLNVLSSTKEEMDARQDLGLHRKNGEEEQKRKEGLQEISSAIQEKQIDNQSSTDDYENKWNHNHHNLPSRCSLLPLHDQLSPPEEKEKKYQLIVHHKQEEKEEKGIHLSESGEVSFSTSQPDWSMDGNNGTPSLEAPSNNKCLLEIKPGKNYQRCIWCINYGAQQESKGTVGCNPSTERPISSSSEPGWECDSDSSGILGVRELRGDECLDFFMPVENGSPYQVSNNVINNGGDSGAMCKLPSLSDLVGATKCDREFREFRELTDKWIVDQEHKKYFSDTFGITNIRPMFVGYSGMVVLFLDDRGILFSWCEMTYEMYILGFNIMEGLANFVYHPKKRCLIDEDTGKLITEVELSELRRRVREELKMDKPIII